MNVKFFYKQQVNRFSICADDEFLTGWSKPQMNPTVKRKKRTQKVRKAIINQFF